MRILFIIILISKISFSQNLNDNVFKFDDAIFEFQKKSFFKSELGFKNLKNSLKNNNCLYYSYTEYYNILSNIKQNESDNKLRLINFIEENSSFPLLNNAKINLGDLFFYEKNYSESSEIYDDILLDKLTIQNIHSLKFNNAFSKYKLGKYDESLKLFYELLDIDSDYQNFSKYMFAIISYQIGNLSSAKKYLLQLIDIEWNINTLIFPILDILCYQKEYEKMIFIESKYINKNQNIEINKLMGEAYHYLKKFNKSIDYFDNYIKNKGKLDPIGNYLLGRNYYELSKYENALVLFNKVVNTSDSLDQNTNYYLANCYLKLGDKESAKNAFESSSSFNYDSTIKELSYFNYAKISYEIGNHFENSSKILEDFIFSFPNSEYINEAYDLLIDISLDNKDYENALKIIDLHNNNNLKNKIKYQRIAYFRGIQLFNDQKYDESIKYFNMSLEYDIDNDFYSFSTYWKAEAFYRIGDYEEAFQNFKIYRNNTLNFYSDEYKLSIYNMGYSKLKLKDYKESIKYFKLYVSISKDKSLISDSYTRIGDINFILKNYDASIENYMQSYNLNLINSDYCLYQVGLCQYLVEDYNLVISNFKDFEIKFSDSRYLDKVLFKIGESFFHLKDNLNSIKYFKKIISNFSGSSIFYEAKMKLALVFYNNNNNNKSIELFKEIVNEFPSKRIATEAVNNAKRAYIEIGEINNFFKWVEKLDFYDISNNSIDSLSFESAELQYLKGNYDIAFKKLNHYIINFPQGLFSLSAHYYLSKSSKIIDSIDKAVESLEILSQSKNNSYLLYSHHQLAIEFFNKKEYEKSIKNFLVMDSLSSSVNEQIEAKKGLINCYELLNNFEKVIQESKELINSGKIDEQLNQQLNLKIARAYYLINDFKSSKKIYELLNQKSQGEMKAEAMYHLSLFSYLEKNISKSKEIIFDQSKLLPNYKYWLSKSLIVLSKNYLSEKDLFQSEYILNQILETSNELEIINEVKLIIDQNNFNINKKEIQNDSL
ncbi:MAG: hypothetical protein CBE48_001710 [Flavobacteriales bacterium TMED288]|nr:hypothetical protein [Flavobacteriales bacterium]RPG53323.1 MAG: hypothetical protein CBE48_001710 [Flavobacteriales bacterium TMED288]|tara:strand:+ start:1244 stop:4237 length:2994 start_codon:yes stop_codon:yes gene_type:complete